MTKKRLELGFFWPFCVFGHQNRVWRAIFWSPFGGIMATKISTDTFLGGDGGRGGAEAGYSPYHHWSALGGHRSGWSISKQAALDSIRSRTFSCWEHLMMTKCRGFSSTAPIRPCLFSRVLVRGTRSRGGWNCNNANMLHIVVLLRPRFFHLRRIAFLFVTRFF